MQRLEYIPDYVVFDLETTGISWKQDFLEYAGDYVLVGHNIHAFDLKFIERDCRRYFGKTLQNDYIDTLKLAKACLLVYGKYMNR